MPASTVYLSRLIGIVSLATAAVMLADKPDATAFAATIMENRTALLALGLFRVLAGGGILLIHNVWSKGLWPLVVTLFAWSMLIRGIAGLFLPRSVFNAAVGCVYVPEYYYLYAAIPLVLGAYLALRGFTAEVAPASTDPTRSA